jgi:HAD superfamily hydrolase (TIGR01509 family)
VTDTSNRDGFRCVLFDWGDTLMMDDASMKGSMAYWPKVEAIPGAAETLSRIKPGRLLALATGAEFSSEAEIRLALARVKLDTWIDAIFCFKNTGLQKPDVAFYRHILNRLDMGPGETLMVGDNFEKDIAAANRAGMRAAWFNPRSAEKKKSRMFWTIHHLLELPELVEKGW